MEQINVKTSSPAGDLISFMAGFKQLHKEVGKKVRVFQRLGMAGVGYADSIHPFQDNEGQPITMNEEMFKMLQPLIKSQPYIDDFVLYNGEFIDFDFDTIRLEKFTNQPKGSLNRWAGYVFPQTQSNLSKKWIEADPVGMPEKKIIVINFTQRYRQHIMTYHFLKKYEGEIYFAGLQKERDLFCNAWGLNIPLLKVKDFLELARIIAGCKFFMGNASFCYQLAEAMKVPRLLELFPALPNVIPVGENAYDYYHQKSCEYLFEKLYSL